MIRKDQLIPVTFEPAKHLQEINQWCQGWQMQEFPDGWLPPTGLIVRGIIAAFLYMTDSKIAIIENVISNPAASKQDRKRCLLQVARELEVIAIDRGFRYLTGSTCNRSIEDTAKQLQWNLTEFNNALMVKTIGEK